MSAHHWIQGHCTKCGVRREKVRVQGPCFIPDVQPKLTEAQMTKAKEMAMGIFSNSQAILDGSAVVNGQANAEQTAKEIMGLINDAGREFGKILYGGKARPYAQNPLFETTPSKRSIEPHKKRREK